MAADCRLYCAGTLIAFPYLARNVLISGWLFYPFTFLDWFPVDWKISKGYADSDAKEIQAYAREIYNVYQLDQPLKQWLPNWFAAQAGFDKLLVLAGWAAIPVSAVLAVLGAVRAVRAGQVTVAPHVDGAVSAENGTRAFRADGRRLRPVRVVLCLNGKPAHPCRPPSRTSYALVFFPASAVCSGRFFLLAARGAAGAVRIFLCVVFAVDGVWKPVLYGGGKAGWFRTGTQWT